jgi:hypothetical protein
VTSVEGTTEFSDVAAIMRDRASDAVTGTSNAARGSTGDIVERLRELGIHKHKAWVGEVADMLFGEAVRPRPSAHRRINDEQFDVLCRAYVLCAAYGYTMEEVADYIHGRKSALEMRDHLHRGLALIDTLDELAPAALQLHDDHHDVEPAEAVIDINE